MGLLMANSILSDAVESKADIEQEESEPSYNITDKTFDLDRLVADKKLPTKSLASNVSPQNIKQVVKISAKDKNILIIPRFLTFDYSLKAYLKPSQPQLINRSLSFTKPLLLTLTIDLNKQVSTNYHNAQSALNITEYHFAEIDRQDLAYIEEELLISQETEFSFNAEKTSAWDKLFSFKSLDLGDKALIGTALALIASLIIIALYSRFHTY